MDEPKLYGTLSIGSIPFKIPGNTITRGNLTVLTPEDFPQIPEDQFLLGRLLNFGPLIRNPIVVEFAKVLVRDRKARDRAKKEQDEKEAARIRRVAEEDKRKAKQAEQDKEIAIQKAERELGKREKEAKQEADEASVTSSDGSAAQLATIVPDAPQSPPRAAWATRRRVTNGGYHIG
jgi:hypothetical protein